jgi:hypothetical protein
MSDNTIDPSLPSDDISEDEVNDAAVPYRIGLLEDLADPEEVMAYVEAALEDGNQEVIKLALRHVIQA